MTKKAELTEEQKMASVAYKAMQKALMRVVELDGMENGGIAAKLAQVMSDLEAKYGKVV